MFKHIWLVFVIVVFGFFISPMDLFNETPSQLSHHTVPDGIVMTIAYKAKDKATSKMDTATNNFTNEFSNWANYQVTKYQDNSNDD